MRRQVNRLMQFYGLPNVNEYDDPGNAVGILVDIIIDQEKRLRVLEEWSNRTPNRTGFAPGEHSPT